MAVRVSQDPEVYFNTEGVPDWERVQKALAEAFEGTQPPPDNPDDLREAVKQLRVAKSQILFLKHLGVYGDVPGDPSFYDDVCDVLTMVQDDLEGMDPLEYNDVMQQAFRFRKLNNPIAIWNRAQKLSVVSPPLMPSPLTALRSRSEGNWPVPEDDPFVAKRPRSAMGNSASPMTDAIFARSAALVGTGMNTEDDKDDPPGLEDFAFIPGPEELLKQWQSLVALRGLNRTNRVRLKVWGAATFAVSMVYTNAVTGGVAEFYATFFEAVSAAVAAGSLFLPFLPPKVAVHGLGLKGLVDGLKTFFLWRREIETGKVRVEAGTNSGIFWSNFNLGPKDTALDMSFGNKKVLANQLAADVVSDKNRARTEQLASFFVSLFNVLKDVLAELKKSPMLLTCVMGAFSVILFDYHRCYKRAAIELFLEANDKNSDEKWAERLNEEADLTLRYFQEYYQHFRGGRDPNDSRSQRAQEQNPRYVDHEWLADVKHILRDAKTKINDALQRRKKLRDDKKADQLEATRAFWKEMKAAARVIRDLPREEAVERDKDDGTIKVRHGLPHNTASLDAKALQQRMQTWEQGQTALELEVIENHYENFQRWKKNEKRQREAERRKNPVFFPPQRPGNARPVTVLHDDNDSDDDGGGDDEEEDDEEEEDDDDDDDDDNDDGDDDEGPDARAGSRNMLEQLLAERRASLVVDASVVEYAFARLGL